MMMAQRPFATRDEHAAKAFDKRWPGKCGTCLGLIKDVQHWADSTGRRNTFDYILFEQLVESFGGSSPAEGFAWSCVQSMRDRAQLIDAVLAEIRALWKVLSQQAVGIFVAPALPRALWVAEVDFQPRIDLELRMLGHLYTLIPSQRTPKNRRKSHDCSCDSIADSFSAMASQRWSVLGHIARSIALHARQVQKHGEACCALDQRSNR